MNKGLIVEKVNNIRILGHERLEGEEEEGVDRKSEFFPSAAMNFKMRDPLFGKMVYICTGEYKGFKG
jgi:hypothetical protein